MGYWSMVAADQNADPRDRGYANWLVGAEKVVLSTTLTEPLWDRTWVVNAPVTDVVADLGSSGEGAILVNNSASVIKPLLWADLLDRLYVMITPEIAGGGKRLFDDGLPASKWMLAHQATAEMGELAMVYDRVR